MSCEDTGAAARVGGGQVRLDVFVLYQRRVSAGAEKHALDSFFTFLLEEVTWEMRGLEHDIEEGR